ncbi:MAG: polysaccharide biosynthesis/export family protein, partial [Bacteroides ovatus]|nr:polysaccharide biosynthesis/export family protein [Bacteroides ovatus]
MKIQTLFQTFLLFLILGVFSPLMAQSMSDSQVLEYVKDGIRQGKEQKQLLEDHPSTQDLARGNQVFGRNIFNTRNLTFEPSVNIATPLNYRLGPGDEVIIDIWGASQNTIRQQISPDGTINIQKIGPVNLNGLTIAEANDYLKKTLNKIYNGLNNANDPTSDIRLTLGSIRTI